MILLFILSLLLCKIDLVSNSFYNKNIFLLQVPGYTSEKVVPADEDLEQKVARLELSGVGGSWGALRIRCEASLFRLYRANSLAVEVRPDTPQPASVLLMGPSTSKFYSVVKDFFCTGVRTAKFSLNSSF